MKQFLMHGTPDREPRIPAQTEQNGKNFAGFFVTVVSDVGHVRRNNEDNYLVSRFLNEDCGKSGAVSRFVPCPRTGWNIVGVFDGMGGGEKGELAALLTARVFRDLEPTLTRTGSRDEVDRMVRAAFRDANSRIVDLQESCGVYGTTASVVCTDGNVFKIYHLGDSRIYLLRNRDLFQLSRDHTLAQMKISAGMYREDDPRAEADRHKLTEYVGRDWSRETIGPEESQFIPISEGDSLLLCTDGLYDMCTDQEISRILNSGADSKRKAAMLAERALEKGGLDNVTCICMDFAK